MQLWEHQGACRRQRLRRLGRPFHSLRRGQVGCNLAAFRPVTISETSKARFEGEEIGLLKRPWAIGHWLLDYAVNAKSAPGKFSVCERPDGLLEHLPGRILEPEYAAGLRLVLSAPSPVAWIESESRLDEIARAFLAFVRSEEDGSLGRLCREARASLESEPVAQGN